jgi:S-adenosylmethionine decarboxylase
VILLTGSESLRGNGLRDWSQPGLADRCTVSCHIMPGMDAASRYAELRRQEALTPKLLYAVDARLTRSSPVADIARLTALATAAVTAANGHVLDTSHVIFPNGAITLVLILAESHLSIHTWPEENLVAIDLFSCGAIDGQAVISGLTRSLRLEAVTVRTLGRGLDRDGNSPPS